ncbi:hypothetical protein APASM_2694 [Actinosynnema pretiosum subsp. pretiosum]|nr:hypothetical protein APASM_2694 [Actinosynnema pretiosum subsp. pretiosum]
MASAGDTAESARALTALHSALGALFEATGDLTPLRESARAARSALEVAPEGPDRVAALAGAAERQRVLAELTGDVGALAEAEGNARAALELGRRTTRTCWRGWRTRCGRGSRRPVTWRRCARRSTWTTTRWRRPRTGTCGCPAG